MDDMIGLAWAPAAKEGGDQVMVFDWDAAARLIKAHEPEIASAGLDGDWSMTVDVIWRDGGPAMDFRGYLASLWATPEIEMDGVRSACYRPRAEVPGWDASTVWPQIALDILAGEVAGELGYGGGGR